MVYYCLNHIVTIAIMTILISNLDQQTSKGYSTGVYHKKLSDNDYWGSSPVVFINDIFVNPGLTPIAIIVVILLSPT